MVLVDVIKYLNEDECNLLLYHLEIFVENADLDGDFERTTHVMEKSKQLLKKLTTKETY